VGVVGRAWELPVVRKANGTNNIAGLRAVLDALQRPPDVAHLVIQIDSTYAPDSSTTWCAGTTRL